MLALSLIALFGLLDGRIAPDAKTQLWLIRFGVFAPTVLAVLVMTIKWPLHKHSELAVLAGVVIAGACLTAMTLIAAPHFAGILILTFASYAFLELRCIHAIVAGLAVGTLYVLAAVAEASTPGPTVAINAIFLASCNLIGAFTCHVLEQAALKEYWHNRALGEQRRMAERLLRNVLPVPVAQRLKEGSGTIADAHPDVTILFADIVGFTSYAAAVPPAQVVQTLDRLFSCFDELARKHGIEKIKTIGDAYMVAGGLRAHDVHPARAVAEFALDLLSAVDGLNGGLGQRLALRIGIHSGPVVAGVIGKAKFAYDLWGDTVNVASRLENLAEPGTIQVGESTYERLRIHYDFSPRQVVSVKGRGDLPCYVLLGRHASAVSAPARVPVRQRVRFVHGDEIGTAAPAAAMPA